MLQQTSAVLKVIPFVKVGAHLSFQKALCDMMISFKKVVVTIISGLRKGCSRAEGAYLDHF